MGRWTKKQNFNLQPQFKKIKVKVTIERNITLSLHLVHSIIVNFFLYIIGIWWRWCYWVFSMRANLVYLIFPTTHTKDTFCQYVFLSVKCTRRRRTLHNLVFSRSGFRFPCGIFLPKVCRIWNLWWIIISTLHIAWFCWIQSKISQKRKHFTFCLHRQNCPIISVIGMIRDGKLSSKAMRKVPW